MNPNTIYHMGLISKIYKISLRRKKRSGKKRRGKKKKRTITARGRRSSGASMKPLQGGLVNPR
jgi:hypothetical protein